MDSNAVIVFIGEGQSDHVNALAKKYRVFTARSGKQGLKLVELHDAQIVVLDAISLRTNGLRICQQLRDALPKMPIIHLYPGDDKTVTSAADVVLVMPFTARKVLNAVKRLLTANNVNPNGKTMLNCGPFALSVEKRILLAHEHELSLTPKQAELLAIFFQRPGEVLDRGWLMREVWDTEYTGDTRTLSVHISWLRELLEQGSAPRYLKTVRGVGYKFELTDE